MLSSRETTLTTQANSQVDDELFRFEAEIRDPKRLIPMLRSINIMRTTVMAITSKGLKLTCQDSGRCLQANSFIDRTLFDRYSMSNETIPVSVCFRLTDLLHVLTLMCGSVPVAIASDVHMVGGGDDVLRLKYSSDVERIRLEFREETAHKKAYIRTYEVEELMIFHMNCINKVILNAEPIVDFWKSCDLSSDHIEVGITADEPYLRWSTDSERARVHYNINKDSPDVEQFMHSEDVTNRYKMSLMKFTLKALINSSKLSIRTDADGLLSLQFMIRLKDDRDQPVEHCFVEYFIVPEVNVHLYQS
ncbi:cell cycle checkpoint protein RAD1-like [Oppia nitens]|uniref:cell cycle checkpoint protein RAD1-like n=1 Tax=Oppia nitens TaxID=1686743 RepID=UPI0023DC3052|nr:cell cycle checkpoint protein RAD1-like [Oppia nitens]